MTSTEPPQKITTSNYGYSKWAKKITPKRVHWLSLVLAALILAWTARNQWFYLDEWSFLVDRSIRPTGDALNIFAGHNGHWSTFTVLGYRLLFKLFGVRTYAPYLVVLFAFHLTLCHFLWRLLLRVGTQAWTAVAAIAIFAVLGAGAENLLWAFQWQLFGPLLFGVGALLLIRTTGRTQRNDVIAAGLLVLAVATSGTAITATAVVAIALFLRRRFHALVFVIGPAALAYSAWFLLVGRNEPSNSYAETLSTNVQNIPAYVWRGLTDAVDLSTGLAGIGAIVIIGITIFAVRQAQPRQEPWPLVLASAAGGVLFLVLVAIARSDFGIFAVAWSSRYIYIVVALLLPLATLAFDHITLKRQLRPIILALLTVTLLVTQISALHSEAVKTASQEQLEKRRFLATAKLANKKTPFLVTNALDIFGITVSAEELITLLRNGDLPGNVNLSPSDFLDARLWTQIALGDVPMVEGPPPLITSFESVELTPDGPECVIASPKSPAPKITLRFPQPSSLSLQNPLGGTLVVTAKNEKGRASRPLVIPAGPQQVLSVAWPAQALTITLPFSSPTHLCGVLPPPK
ncbi:MAG: hypothetical protein F2861_08255 [Actinobacteria bacterium]|uniref:Unannotated protein n=1 Tax=freshwater metagenome TaxID=449393 RepID=A0A6J7N8I6_9ZZZZ|nr:hypothetical protein [Actinomycetota bacterium]